MAIESAIEWTDSTWNPVTGCTKLSSGCDHCYAERFSERFRGVKGHPFESGFDLTLRPERINQPRNWRKPRMIFVNSMSDLFHKKIPLTFVDQVFDTMESADWHIYQILTKRSSLMRNYINRRYPDVSSPPHIWLGVSIENSATLSRLNHLKAANASLRFISFEPLLGDIGKVDFNGIHWVITGGESGAGARKVNVEWLRNIRDQCQSQQVPFFFKQWGGYTPKTGGNTLDNHKWLEYPRMSNDAHNFDTGMQVAGAPVKSANHPMEVGPWAEEKLGCLKKYLNAYTQIMSRQDWCTNYWYVDAFAGPGALSIRQRDSDQNVQDTLPGLSPFVEENITDELRQMINGSPKIALDTNPHFSDYLFIDLNSAHLQSLKKLRLIYQKKDSRQIYIREGDCNIVLRNWLEHHNWNKCRGVIFLDPFGMQVPWSTIEKIAETKALEIIINFPVGMAIQRLLKNNADFSSNEKKKLDEYFGTDEWFDVVYVKERTLWGETTRKVERAEEKLLEWYLNRLGGIFEFVSKPRAIKNTKQRLLYYLLFSGHNKIGYKIASHILEQGVRI